MNKENNLAWVGRDESVIAPCQHLSYFPMTIDHIDHDMIYDVEGNSYIDFLSSASSLNLGSCHPVVMDAVKKQLEDTENQLKEQYKDYKSPEDYKTLADENATLKIKESFENMSPELFKSVDGRKLIANYKNIIKETDRNKYINK